MTFQLVVVIVGLLVGWIRKGSIWTFTNVRIRAVWLLPICYILQTYSIAKLKGQTYEWMVVISYVGLLLFMGINRRTPGMYWAFCGTLANFIVLVANGLRMPAYLPAIRQINPAVIPALIRGEYGKSVAMTSKTHLNFLGDIFTFDFGTVTLISIGDILFAVGLVIFIQYVMTQHRSAQNAQNAKA